MAGKVTGWKQHERDSGALIDGKRYPANMGDRLDVESAWAVGQCKHVRSMSLMQLVRLAEEMHAIASLKGKLGLVFTKIKLGSGRPASRVVTMHESQWLIVRSIIRELRALKGIEHGVSVDGSAPAEREIRDQDGL